MITKIKKISLSVEDIMAERFYNTIHSRRIKKGIIKGKIRRISEYYANGEMSKEDFDRMKSKLELRLKSI